MISCTRFLYTVFSFLALQLYARERITDFASNILVHQDGSMDVTETIQVVSEGYEIKRGIVREFPTRYYDKFGTHYTVGFALKSVVHNQQPTKFHTQMASNGIRVYMGDRDTYLEPGKHTYTMVYSTHRQLGYFKEHDELFWNITGNGWRLPIEHARFTIALPRAIPANAVKVAGYTGYDGETGSDYTIAVTPERTIVGHTTRPLRPYEGLTIAVGWPKGYVQQPTLLTNVYHFFYDNLPIILLFLLITIIVCIYLVVWLKAYVADRDGTIIPLFYPPEGLSPAEIACINAMKYDSKALGATVVNIAVKGVIKLEYIPETALSASYYVVHRNEESVKNALKVLSAHEYAFFTRLFPADATTCALRSSEQYVTSAAQVFVQKVEATLDRYVDQRGELIAGLALLTVCGYAGVILLAYLYVSYEWFLNSGWLWATAGAAIVMHALGTWLIKSYTPRGRELKKSIDGFKMFLEATQAERLKIIGTPPTQTPELYETYLPYAIALGVEEQWSKQFQALFIRLKDEGREYRPLWYMGGGWPRYGHMHFARSLSHVVPSTIASGVRPGSQSGFGKGGSGFGGGAGRGGGGGGGGGW